MQKCCLGSTGIEVSRLGLGTVKFGRTEGVKYAARFNLPSDTEIAKLLALAAEVGINLLDTAPAYGTSEERLGKILSQRNRWVLSTKVGEEFKDGDSIFDFSPSAVRASVERSLRRLRTDYLDIVLVHSNGDDQRIIAEQNIFSTLADLKQEGKLRAYGMSTKTIEGGTITIDQSDLAMVTFHPTYLEERPIIQHALQSKKGIFIKKAFASGQQVTPDSLRFILAEPGVTSIIMGTINPEHLKENVMGVL